MTAESTASATSPSHEQGVALIATLLLTLLLAALAAALATMSIVESRVLMNFRDGRQTRYVAGAGIERMLETLAHAPGWTDVLRGLSPSGLVDGSTSILLPGAALMDIDALTAQLQRRSDARFDRGPDNPVWAVYACGRAGRLLSTTAAGSDWFLVVWVADDGGEWDGDPRSDTNGLLLVRSEAFGPTGARRSVEALVERQPLASNLHGSGGESTGTGGGGASGPVVRLRSWREVS